MARLIIVSTHSRPKAAGTKMCTQSQNGSVSTHSRPKAAGQATNASNNKTYVSTHSRPKAAGYLVRFTLGFQCVSTHSRPKAAGSPNTKRSNAGMFQHTAARRRLALINLSKMASLLVFQHTAARRRLGQNNQINSWQICFNTQPPEGGWVKNGKND